jgi:hypothetical protein
MSIIKVRKPKQIKFFGLGKNDGQSPTQALWVKMAEGMGFGNQGNRRNQPGRNNRRPGRRPQPRPGGPGGGGGGLFSKIGQGFKSVTSSVGKGLKNVTGSVGKAVSGINPLSALKKGLTSNAGKFIGKAAKGGLIGALLNVGSLASILAGDGTPQQKAEQIIPLAASIILYFPVENK